MPFVSFRIREAHSEDWDFVQALYREGTSITHPDFHPVQVDDHIRQRKNRWLCNDSYALIAENFTGKLGVIWVLPDMSTPHKDYIQLVAVEKKHRKKGVGTELLLEAVERSRVRERLSLRAGIQKKNKASLSLFEKFGFLSEADQDDLKFYVVPLRERDRQDLQKDVRLDLLRLAVDLSERESDRFWTRYSMMLYANTGLLGIIAYSISTPNCWLATLVSLVGIPLSISWFCLIKLSYFYDHRWHADMEALIRSSPAIRKWLRGRILPRIKRPFRRTLPLIEISPVVFLIFWLVILVLSVLGKLGILGK
jgi:L-amino acid N-acyltransferase YncA